MAATFPPAPFAVRSTCIEMAYQYHSTTNIANRINICSMGDHTIASFHAPSNPPHCIDPGSWIYDCCVIVDGTVGTIVDVTCQLELESLTRGPCLVGETGVALSHLIGVIASIYSTICSQGHHGYSSTLGTFGMECQGICTGGTQR